MSADHTWYFCLQLYFVTSMGSNENSCWCKMLPANTLPFVFVSLLLAATKEGGVCVPPAALHILLTEVIVGFVLREQRVAASWHGYWQISVHRTRCVSWYSSSRNGASCGKPSLGWDCWYGRRTKFLFIPSALCRLVVPGSWVWFDLRHEPWIGKQFDSSFASNDYGKARNIVKYWYKWICLPPKIPVFCF